MKRAIKRIGKCLIIYIVIIMLFLSNVGYCGYTPEEVGDAVAGFAAHVSTTCKDHLGYRQLVGDKYDNSAHGGEPGHGREDNPIWKPSSYSWDDYMYFDCSSFASGCVHYVTGLFESAQSTYSLVGFGSPNWEKGLITSKSLLRVGDIVFTNDNGHALIYVGSDMEGADGKDLCEVGGASSFTGFRNADGYIDYSR